MTLIFLLPTISARADGGDRIPYAVFDATTGTLTFKYDTQKPNGAFEIKENEYPDWCSSAPDIKKVKFEESFAEFTPTSCAYWLDSCYNLTEIIDMDKYLKTENVINMDKMFSYCSSLKSINLSGFNTTKVEYMYSLFAGCANLATIYVGNNWNTDNVKSSYDMFYGCEMLYGEKGTECVPGNVDASFAHIDKGTSDPGYFTQYGNTPYTPIINYDEKQPYAVVDNGVLTFYCNNKRPAKSFSMPKFDRISWSNLAGQFTKVKFDESFNDYTPTDLNYWFYSCTNLSSIDGTENLNTSEVNSMLRMFYNCSSLKNLDLHSLNTTKVETLSDMFVGCESLETLDLSGFNTNNLKWMGYMFCNCRNLATIYVGNNWNTDNVEESFDMFSGCDVLVGGNGTTYDVNYTDATYARIDDPENGKPGYFSKKGEPVAPALVNGVYQITSAANLLWFANYVNSGNPNANAKLCADIVLNENLLSKIEKGKTENLVTWIPIGTADNPYKGTFTTDTFAISGLYVNDSKQNYVGLFGYYAPENTQYVYYINVKDSYFAGHDFVGGLFGYVNSEKARLSDFYFRGEVSGNSNVGGLFGKIDVFESLSSGYVSAKVTGSSNVGSVCGYLDGKTENNSFDYLYYDTQLCSLGAINGTDDVENYIIGKNTFHTGEVAYFLCLRQDLSDPSSFPEFKGQFVHKNLSGVGYHNPVYQDNHCTKCINYTYELPQLVNGVYQISTADELYGFMHLVNTGNNYANAVLTADIVINENVLEKVHAGTTEGLREWYSIGDNGWLGYNFTNGTFAGIFDGNFHTISGLYFNSQIRGNVQCGFISNLNGIVKNVIIADTYFKSAYDDASGIARYLTDMLYDSEFRYVIGYTNPLIENCIFDGEIVGEKRAAGICLSFSVNKNDDFIKNCINYGKITGGNHSGGILGASWGSGSVVNCYNAGELVCTVEEDLISIGGICGGASLFSISKCYNTGSVSFGYGVYGYHWGACTITNAYNNSDICNLPIVFDEWGGNTITGGGNLTSAQLCNGTLPEGFSSDDWIPGKTVTADDGTITYTFPHLKVFDGKYPAYTITKDPREPYALLTDNGETVTFYYDKDKSQHQDALGFDFDWSPGWKDVKVAIFDESFKEYKPTSCAFWFYNCTQLTEIHHLDYLNTEDVTDMQWMFMGCENLGIIDVSKFNTSKVTNMNMMFYNCSRITELNLSSFDNSQAEYDGIMFYLCKNLTTIYVDDKWITREHDIYFGYCPKLIGGQGTLYNENNKINDFDSPYARIDGGETAPGYFTRKGTTKPEVKSIAITTLPKTAYVLGEELNTDNGELAVTIGNRNPQPHDFQGATVTGYDKTKEGKQTLTVEFLGATTTYDIEIAPLTPIDTIFTAPTKLSYIEGEDLDLTGGYFTIKFNNLETEKITLTNENATISGFDNAKIGEQTISVDYFPNTFTFTVNVEAKTAIAIEITQLPTKLEYLEGEEFVPDGGELIVTYNNKTSETLELAKATITGFDSNTIGEQTVTVDYLGQKAEFKAKVKRKNPYEAPVVIDDVYQITKAQDLFWFVIEVNNGNTGLNAALTNDIVINQDLWKQINKTTKAEPQLTVWKPIGTEHSAFSGTFDGQGHTISGIYINDETQSNVGLFGVTTETAVIKNLGVTDSYISGNENVGAICGKSEGTVVNCYTVSEVVGNKNVNPLVGAKEKAAVVQNSFYLADSPKANDPCAKTAEQFKSGEVAAQLAKGATINGVTYSGESFAGLTELPGTENIEVISDPENPPTPVSEISPNINVNVWSYNHIIYIENAPDAEYRIIDLNGRLITTSTTKSTKEEIQINKSGILIVIIGNQSFKVSL